MNQSRNGREAVGGGVCVCGGGGEGGNRRWTKTLKEELRRKKVKRVSTRQVTYVSKPLFYMYPFVYPVNRYMFQTRVKTERIAGYIIDFTETNGLGRERARY